MAFFFSQLFSGQFVKRYRAHWHKIIAMMRKYINVYDEYWFHAIFGFKWHRVQCCFTAADNKGPRSLSETPRLNTVLYRVLHRASSFFLHFKIKFPFFMSILLSSLYKVLNEYVVYAAIFKMFHKLTHIYLIVCLKCWQAAVSFQISPILSTNKMQLYSFNWLSALH